MHTACIWSAATLTVPKTPQAEGMEDLALEGWEAVAETLKQLQLKAEDVPHQNTPKPIDQIYEKPNQNPKMLRFE